MSETVTLYRPVGQQEHVALRGDNYDQSTLVRVGTYRRVYWTHLLQLASTKHRGQVLAEIGSIRPSVRCWWSLSADVP